MRSRRGAAFPSILSWLALTLLALLLIGLGLLKLVPGWSGAAPDVVGRHGVALVDLAGGGILPRGWGSLLVGGAQVLLGALLLVPPWRCWAAVGCLLAALALAVGIGWYWPLLVTAQGLTEAGIALALLTALLLAGGALAAQSAGGGAARPADEGREKQDKKDKKDRKP